MRNVTVARVWGIPIKVNFSLLVFLPVLAWLIGGGEQIPVYAGFIGTLTGVPLDVTSLRVGATPWLIGAVAAVGLFVSVTLHELGHSWVSLRYGLSIESITLWILGGMASLREIPREWNREFWIAIAGPTTSVLVGVGAYVLTVVTPPTVPAVRFVFGWLAVTNVVLALFNLLPAFPMDGGRILRALLARSRPYGTATRIAGRIGVVFAVLFAVIGVLGFNVILLLLAFFLYSAATTESRTVLLDELLEGITVGDIMTAQPATIPAHTTVEALAESVFRDHQPVYPVLGEDGRALGVVTIADLGRVRAADRAATTVGDIVRTVPRVSPEADAFETLIELNRQRGAEALVTADGQFLGTLTQSDFTTALTIQREFHRGATR